MEKQFGGGSRGSLVVAAGITLAVVAWGYLVWSAIDFGRAARAGDSSAWTMVGLASLGAIACLFVGLLLVARLADRLGLTSDEYESPDLDEAVPDQPVSALRYYKSPLLPAPVEDQTPPAVAFPVPVPARGYGTRTAEPPSPPAQPSPPVEVSAPVEVRAEPEPEQAPEQEPAVATAAEPATAPDPLSDPLGSDAWTPAPPRTPGTPGTPAETGYTGRRVAGRHAGGPPTEDAPPRPVPPGVAGKRRANV